MAKTFFGILVLGVVLIMVVGLFLNYGQPMPTDDTEQTQFVDDVTLDKAIMEGRILTLPFQNALRQTMKVAAWFSALLFATFLVALIFSRFGDTGLMTVLRWRREDEAFRRNSAYKSPGRREGEVPVHRIDKNNP